MRGRAAKIRVIGPGGALPGARDDRGSASVLAVALLAALLMATAAAIGACALLAEKQHVSAAADAAALAAADTASGLASGFPCGQAQRAATLNGARLAQCDIDGADAVVSATASIGGVPILVRARAGPPTP